MQCTSCTVEIEGHGFAPQGEREDPGSLCRRCWQESFLVDTCGCGVVLDGTTASHKDAVCCTDCEVTAAENAFDI